jgi:curved DNA-binding protein CbpA
MPKSTHSKTHYAYLNELLNLDENQQLEAGKDIQDKEAIISRAQQELDGMQKKASTEAIQNEINKLQRALEILRDDEKRKQYDAALKAFPSVQLSSQEEKGGGIQTVPLVPINKILSEFEDFKKEWLAKKDEKGNPLFSEGDFKYRKIDGPPTIHILTFPDEASANAFLARLFNKNMAMLPNGSQNIKEVESLRRQHNLKEKLATTKGEEGIANSKGLAEEGVEEKKEMPLSP